MYSQYEAQKDGNKVPVIEVDGNPTKDGDYYAPTWKIVKMVDRPTSLPQAGAPAKAPAAAPAASSDEF